MSPSATFVNNYENGHCVQHPSSRTSGVPVAPSNTMTTRATGRNHGNRKRSRGSTSLAREEGQTSSSEPNAIPTRSRRTTPRTVIEDYITPAEGAILHSPLVRGTSDVPFPPSGGHQSRSGRKASLSRTYEGSRSSSATGDEVPGISSETADREDAGVSEDDLTPAERAISATRLLSGLGKHPSVYARAGRNPPPQGLSFRGAWKNAVELYSVANHQYKELLHNAGFEDFLKINPVELPQGYLIALMERWFAQTNTVHLPCGEIGPTPLDWTMITGLRFGGQSISLDPNYAKDEAVKLLGLKRRKRVFQGNRITLSAIRPTEAQVRAFPANDVIKERISRRLFLYVIGSCFFGNSKSVIHHELVKLVEDIHAVPDYDWGAFTYAAFLVGMRRKVTGQIGSFTAFWPFLVFWAFEYLNICRPEHTENVNVFPRAMRWKFPENGGTLDNFDLTASRCQLDYVDDESKVTWQPYLDSEKYSSVDIKTSIDLAKSRVPFRSFATWEYYLGERCGRQLGLPCLVPSDPPKKLYRDFTKKSPSGKVKENKEPPTIENAAETLVESENLEYASWFAENSIGKIVDVTRLIGGTAIGRKVISDWMAKHRTGIVLVPKSEVEEITLACDAADAERKKLQEELSQLRRG
ncbi:hypothetical protein ACET3Z_020459 [Daucus carota]